MRTSNEAAERIAQNAKESIKLREEKSLNDYVEKYMKKHKKINENKQDMKEFNNKVKYVLLIYSLESNKNDFNDKIINNIEKERRTDEKRRREIYKQYENKVEKAKRIKEEKTVMIISK